MTKPSFNCDGLLQDKVKIYQPENAYKAGLDAVFLAAACPANPSQSVLDVGCGVGAVFLCLSARVSNLKITAVEAHTEYSSLAKQNALINKVEAQIIDYTIPHKPDPLTGRKFDHVITNPPYLEKNHHAPSSQKIRAAALGESASILKEWLDYCLRKLSDKGHITFIFPTNRMDDALTFIHGRVGNIRIFPLWSNPDLCKRIIITGRKNAKGGTTLLKGMLVHSHDGSYTVEAQKILKKNEAIDWGVKKKNL